MPVSKTQYLAEEIVKMSTKLVPAICTQCSGSVEVDPSQEKASCKYCGTTFFIEKAIKNFNIQHANIEHVESMNIHNNNRGTVESILEFIEKQQDRRQKKIAEEKRRLEEEKRKQDKYGIIAILFCLIIMAFLWNSLETTDEESNHQGEARTPGESSYYEGRDYKDVVSEFEANGFTNVETEKLDNLITGWLTNDGEVEAVSIDGDVEYTDDWYPENVKVVITYHTFREKGADDVIEDQK